MKNLFVFFFFLLLNCSIKGQNIENDIPPMEVKTSPYTIRIEKLKVNLPDTLTDHKHLTGRVGIILFIDDHKIIKGFNIILLQLNSNNEKIINYYKYNNEPVLCNDYPSEIRKYWIFFSKFIKTLSLKKNRKAVIEKNNSVFFMLTVQ
ncbi:MAG TPA: hypothetical protein VIH57_06510 [Bacteroidales bacterium]